MKRAFLLMTLALLFGFQASAQNESKAKSIKSNIEKSDAAIQDAKKSINPNTWMSRGKLFHEAYGLNVDFARQIGKPDDEKMLFLGEEPQVLKTQENGVPVETHEFSRIKLIYKNGVFFAWDETQPIVEKPLEKAIDAYEKAKSLDEKGKLTKKINEAYVLINNDLEGKIANELTLERFRDVYESSQLKIRLNGYLGKIDTLYYYYAGYAAYHYNERQGGNIWKETEEALEKAIPLGFEPEGMEGSMYDMMYVATLNASGDTAKALSYVQKGLEIYPENMQLLYRMINYYLNREESEKAMDYLKKAQKDDPNNTMLLFVEGTLLERMGDTDKAVEVYDKVITLKPDYFDAYYNKSVAYYNKAAKYLEEGNAPNKTFKEYEELKNLAELEFEKAIPPMEKALELMPTNKDALETLKSMYFRLRIKHPEMEAKYNDTVKKLEAL
ncbi:MAG: tetratricopeptide repeat protein [Bacteroidales bacterium]|jgi:tetratricopeptide (TPR) repeat protein|nr:tetratricopeptide repeat protein [Bacteroidales bacterium]